MTTNDQASSPKKNWFIQHKFLTAIFAVVILLIVSGSGSGVNTSTSRSSSTTNVEEQKASPIPQGKVEVKSKKKVMNYGYTKVVGEVENNTDNPVSSVKVTATFYDKNNEVIGTSFTYAGDTSSTPLEVKATAPFEISSYPEQFDTDNFKLDVTWR